MPPMAAPSSKTPESANKPGPANNPQPCIHVAESAFEFLLGEILNWVEFECDKQNKQKNAIATTGTSTADTVVADDDASRTSRVVTDWKGDGNSQRGGGGASVAAREETSREEQAILAAERAAAKIERLGFGVGYRLCERLAQGKPLSTNVSSSGGQGGGDPSASSHLEAVKFLCKEFWTEVFRKQIDKLQTNHRGVFVLKDHELRWLRRLPSDDERARVAAIKMLAFPCGLIRGALSNLGIAAVVSCDFLADGKNMAACSFNIKIKT